MPLYNSNLNIINLPEGTPHILGRKSIIKERNRYYIVYILIVQ